MNKLKTEHLEDAIAVIGMAGRFPGARNTEELWQNLRDGVCSIVFFSDEEALESGLDPAFLENPDFVKAYGVLNGIELFDAKFFNMSPREARILDPQHRVFLECAWEAMENAGYVSDNYDGRVGVYAGTGLSTYLLRNLMPSNIFTYVSAERLEMAITNQKDLMPMRASYELNLTGPSINVNTTCSTSLVATHLACQSLKTYECDMALAGGVFVRVPQKEGYLYQEGTVYSDDGYIRAFDAKAKGIVIGSGGGVVVLKRLENALSDGDSINAIILSTAVNNDGATKLGYTAPGVEGQEKATVEAISFADIPSDTITYVEAHGTGTALGDPVEFESLTRSFRATAEDRENLEKGYCAIGSVKTNLGHTNHGAGVSGLIKTVMSLKNRMIPGSLHFEEPNPKMDFENSPFYVNTSLKEWETNGIPRRALVNSFGIGGTNAHVVLEEAPDLPPSGPSRPWQLLTLSARTLSALETMTENLAAHLGKNPDLNLADAACTLKLGRKAMPCRRSVLCRDTADATKVLSECDPKRMFSSTCETEGKKVVFMFSGQGAQYVNMAKELYVTELLFKEQVDLCSEILRSHLGFDLCGIIYPGNGGEKEAEEKLRETAITQPALFVVEYALARLWMSWGVEPVSMIGHSIGEYVAACLSGVFTLEDALALVVERGIMMQEMAPGDMLAVPLPAEKLGPFLDKDLSLSVVNGPDLCVAGGTAQSVAGLKAKLKEHGIEGTLLHTSHAFHSHMMAPVAGPFVERVGRMTLSPPKIPYISNVTGNWIKDEEAMDPEYWGRHLRHTVHFADGMGVLVKDPDLVLLEVGPGRTLNTLAVRHPDKSGDQVSLTSVRHPKERVNSDVAFILMTLGKLWLAGVKTDWAGFYKNERRHRVPLPSYPFERRRYWIDTPKRTTVTPGTYVRPEIDDMENEETVSDPAAGDKAGMSPKEERIKQIWEDVLTIDNIGKHDDFFELGGNSLIAVALVSRLKTALKVELTVRDFLNFPTISELSGIIDISRENKSGKIKNPPKPKSLPKCMMRIKGGSGSKRPLFLVHPIEGQVFFYRDLALGLNTDRRVYAFQARGLGRGEEPFTTIPDMAAHYVDSLLEKQPKGPFLLGGTSFGGIVAFEMSQILTAAGESVELLFLIDSPMPQKTPFKLDDDSDIVVFIARNILKIDKDRISRDQLRQLDLNGQINRLLEEAKHNGSLPEDYEASGLMRLIRVFKANEKAMNRYSPSTYPGRLIYFRAKESWNVNGSYRPEFFWTDYAGEGIEINTVPGNHITMNYGENVLPMAKRIGACLG
ncbi:MAG: alpha/beta fold hydrolase [Desulfobacterales bacterium]|nr:alpha/beta fold hydrolase [Desulfobacterales bacterium]